MYLMTGTCLHRQILPLEDMVSTNEILNLSVQLVEDDDNDAIDINIHILSHDELDQIHSEEFQVMEQR